jgi:hypothetical protein
MLKKLFRTIWKIVKVSTAIVAGLLLLFILIWTDTDFVTSSTSESGDYEIIIRGNEPFLFGPQTVYVYGREKLWVKRLFTTSVFNDGGRIGKENVIIKWDGDKATIILKGDEQEDEIHHVEFTRENINLREMNTK